MNDFKRKKEKKLTIHTTISERSNEILDKLVEVKNDSDEKIYGNKSKVIEKALEFHLESLKLREGIKDKEALIFSLVATGMIYHEQKGNLNTALEYHNRSLTLSKEIFNDYSAGVAYGNIGEVYSLKGDLENALEYMKKKLAAFLDRFRDK